MQSPRILVEVEVHRQKIKRVRLSIADSFRLQILGEDSLTSLLSEWVEGYAAKKPTLPKLPLDFSEIPSPFVQKVVSTLTAIRPNETKSYLQVAEEIGKPKAYRAVGNALGKNPFPLFLPCHRVIYANGKLGGFTPEVEIKKRLLEFENVPK